MKNEGSWLYFFLGISLIFSAIIIGDIIDLQSTHPKIVKCYDRFLNEIIDTNCYEEEFDNPLIESLSKYSSLLMLIILIGALFIISGFISFFYDQNEK